MHNTDVVAQNNGFLKFLDAQIVARTAELLGKTDDAKKYAALAASIRAAFNRRLYQSGGVYSIGSQTAQSCALHQGLVPAAERSAVEAKLVAAVEQTQGFPDFGILGSKYIFRSLSEAGRSDLAFAMLAKDEAPSYGNWIKRGATTLWEDWGEGASRNHIMFGDFSAWYYQYLGGIRLDDTVSTIAERVDPGAVAFKRFIICPEPVIGLGWVKAEHDSPYGMIRSAWQRQGGGLRLEVGVPVNTAATVYLPIKPGAKNVVTEVTHELVSETLHRGGTPVAGGDGETGRAHLCRGAGVEFTAGKAGILPAQPSLQLESAELGIGHRVAGGIVLLDVRWRVDEGAEEIRRRREISEVLRALSEQAADLRAVGKRRRLARQGGDGGAIGEAPAVGRKRELGKAAGGAAARPFVAPGEEAVGVAEAMVVFGGLAADLEPGGHAPARCESRAGLRLVDLILGETHVVANPRIREVGQIGEIAAAGLRELPVDVAQRRAAELQAQSGEIRRRQRLRANATNRQKTARRAKACRAGTERSVEKGMVVRSDKDGTKRSD